jgi:hypothetical protein
MEIAAHHHVATETRTATDSIAFTRNSGLHDHPFIDFSVHLPAGGYRRLAAMLDALADEADGAPGSAVAACAHGLPVNRTEDEKAVLRPRLEALSDRLCQTQALILQALQDSGLTVVPLYGETGDPGAPGNVDAGMDA